MLTIQGGDRQSADGASEGSRHDSIEGGRDGLRRGETLAGRYELVRPAGKGGMGAVWMARDRVLDVAVAIKVIRREARVPEAEARLLTEARAAARLGHPAVVRVLDFGRTEWGDPFMAMELLEGETLASMLARERRLSPERAVQLLLPVIDGLSALHTKQIIHRDLKPDNIFLARDEASRVKPKIVDFGIAKLEQRAPAEAITHCGEVLGSPAYMSPEQARGLGGIDHRTDIWSLCVVLYELVAGSRPFVAKNYNAMLRAIIERPAPRIADPEACDEALWTIIEAGLRKEKSERWSSMRELGEALALWLYERGIKEDICASNIRTAWLEAGLSGVKVDLPPSARPLAWQRGADDAPRIGDATAMSAALAVTEPQGAFGGRTAEAEDGFSDSDALEQMRRLLCTGATTESDARSTRGAKESRAEIGADPTAEEQEAHAYTKTTSEAKGPAPEVFEPKLLGSSSRPPRARRTAAAVITCLAAAMCGGSVGLLGPKEGPVEAIDRGPFGAAFAMELESASQGFAANGETKPARLEAPKTGAAEARAEKTSPRPADRREADPKTKKEAQGSASKIPPKEVKPPAAAPKKAPSISRKTTGYDFNFGF